MVLCCHFYRQDSTTQQIHIERLLDLLLIQKRMDGENQTINFQTLRWFWSFCGVCGCRLATWRQNNQSAEE